MKKTNKNNFIILFALFIYLIVNRLYIIKHVIQYDRFIAGTFIMVLFFLSVLLLGYKKPRQTKLKRDVTFLAILTIVAYFVIIYAIGMFKGFLNNPYSTTIYYLFYNLSPVILISIFIEMFRYLMLDINKGNKRIYNITTLLIILFEASIYITYVDLANKQDIFDKLAIILLPIIIKNMSFSYISNRTGYNVPMIYRLVTDLYIYIVPFTPDLGDFLNTTLNIILPFIIYFLTNVYYKQDIDDVEVIKPQMNYTIPISLIVIIVIFMGLSVLMKKNNMEIILNNEDFGKEIHKGDLIVIRKKYTDNALKPGRIIAYTYENNTYIDDIDIVEEEPDEYTVRNEVTINKKDIIGLAAYRIPYVGYPIVYISEKNNNRGEKNE